MLYVTKQNNVVTSNGVTRKRVTGKELSGLKITKPVKNGWIRLKQMESKGSRRGKAISYVFDSYNGRLYHSMYMIPCKRNDLEFFSFLRRVPFSTRLCHTRVSPLLIILSSSVSCLLMGDSLFFSSIPFPSQASKQAIQTQPVVLLWYAFMINVLFLYLRQVGHGSVVIECRQELK